MAALSTGGTIGNYEPSDPTTTRTLRIRDSIEIAEDKYVPNGDFPNTLLTSD